MTTPMMQQYLDAKSRHPGMVLFFRMGDFYELFGEDAEMVAPLLGLTLTSRDGKEKMAGFPHMGLDGHLRRLLEAGHRVAVCDQVEEASQAKGLVRREVTRVITPGTVTEDDLLDPRKPSILAALVFGPKGKGLAGLSWVDVGSGTFFAMDVDPGQICDHLARIDPAELLLAEGSAQSRGQSGDSLGDDLPEGNFSRLGGSRSLRPSWTFDTENARIALHGLFQVTTLSGFGFEDNQICLRAAGALVSYLRETIKAPLVHIRRLQPFVRGKSLQMDETTRRSLELDRTQRDHGRKGSLWETIDRTATSMGSRQLREWLLNPLCELAELSVRQDTVARFVSDSPLRRRLRELLSEVSDLQRLSARAATGRAVPRDLAAIRQALRAVPAIRGLIEDRAMAPAGDTEADSMPSFGSSLWALARRAEPHEDFCELLCQALAEEPKGLPGEGMIIRAGYDPELDELRALRSSGNEWLARFQAAEVARTGIGSLKVGFNSVFGYYIEITHAHTGRVPPDYQRRQTLKNAERYITVELKEHEEKIYSADDKIKNREIDLFGQIRKASTDHALALMGTAEALAELDALAGLGELAVERQWCRPTLVAEPVLDIHQGRHPVLDQILPPGTFVPNDCRMDNQTARLLLVTGPNMGGKSVFIRQAALLTILAQTGSFVPAQSATIGLADRVFTRVGASDELARAQSTFMVEMTEAANILNNATRQSLVILDEIGRGTSTYDGVSLAWAIAEDLHERIGCRALFATHYHELAELSGRLTAMVSLVVQVHETEHDVLFLHRIVPGAADKSYGIHVARRAGIPASILDRAQSLLIELEEARRRAPASPVGSTIMAPRVIQSSLFADMGDPLLDEIRAIDTQALTPDRAHELVTKWVRELGRKTSERPSKARPNKGS